MDEPLSNLDAKLRVQMRSEIKRFHQDLKATIIYVTHDQLEAVTMADKMAVMNGGYLQQYDSPAQVFAHPVNMFVASFVGSPAMSLIPLEASTADGGTVLTSAEGWSLELSQLNARKVAESGDQEGRARRAPLDDQAAQERGPRRHSGQGLYGGANRRRHLRAGVPRPAPSSTSACRPNIAVAPDEQIWLEFDQERMHLFDGETEMALKAN